MTNKYHATPEVIGYKLGAIALCLVAGTTDQLETAQSVQGQPYALMRAWSASALGYVTLGVDASGNLLTAGGVGGSGSTSVDATLKASTAVVGHVVVDSMPSVATSTAVDATLSSLGSTRLVGRVDVNNPTTAVTVSNPTTAVEATLSSAGSTRLVGKVDVNNPTTAVTVSNPSTTVDANLTSAGSSKVIGTVGVSSGAVLGPSTAAIGQISSGSQTIGTVINTSGAINGASTAVIGLVAQGSAGSSADPWNVELMAGSTGVTIGAVALVAGSSANMLGAVANSSGVVNGASSAVIGLVAQGSGSSGNAWFMQSVPYSSGNAARTTVNTTVDISVIAANANRKALVIANLSTAQTVALGLTTAAVTTALGGASLFLGPISQVAFGINGNYPLFTGPVRGINITSTTVAGGVAVTEFT